MTDSTLGQEMLQTSEGDVPLQEFRLPLNGREIVLLHTNALLTPGDEADFLMEFMHIVPYGVALWPSAIALAQEVASRGDALRGTRVLELGAGTGLPGIVAATLGAAVVQTDAQEVALSICRRNGQRNGDPPIDYRLVDWSQWEDESRYDWILGSDILYSEKSHPLLRRIFERNLAPAGRILISDPYRPMALGFLEALEAGGWSVTLAKWSIGEGAGVRRIGVFELTPPRE